MSGLFERAEALHNKAGMPWHQAEELALSELGITETEIDELVGECAPQGLQSLITSEEEIRAFARALLVHGDRLKPVPFNKFESD